jgi:acetylornithine deacetylase/succinyl-diaminopimelate desuccinylase-like protein
MVTIEKRWLYGMILIHGLYQIPGATGRNPLVYGRFAGKRSSDEEGQDKKIPTVLIYGHYDVIAAENENDDWQTDPFKLTGKNGYLYGRGTSDNKVIESGVEDYVYKG